MTPLVLIDMAAERLSPAGGCVRLQAQALSQHRPVVLVTGSTDLVEGPHLRVVRVRLPKRPVLLRYLVFHWQAARALRQLLPTLPAGTLVQCTQGQWPGAQVSYAHYCHTAYLKGEWAPAGVGLLRRLARYLNHRFNAWAEAKAFDAARAVVVPSGGLARELEATFPHLRGRVSVVPNPVDLGSFHRPAHFDRAAARLQLGLQADETVVSFVALGDFERKGLGLLIAALAQMASEQRKSLRLLVVGGQPSEVARYRQQAVDAGVGDRLVFVGLQKDVRPYLWMSDAFTLPSAYETFSLVVLQACAAGLPVLVSRGLHGVEDYVADGEQGWVVDRSVQAIRTGLSELQNSPERLPTMALKAEQAARDYSEPAFIEAWTKFYASR